MPDQEYDLPQIRQFIENRFSLEDLKTLCQDLSVDFDAIGGENKEGKARELVQYFANRANLAELVAKLREERPNIAHELDQTPTATEANPGTVPDSVNVFISYKRKRKPDEDVALALYERLKDQHTTFIDQAMTVGTHWAEQIKAEIYKADFFVVFLSYESINSEMVREEIRFAHQAQQENGRPTILPVRLAYTEPFKYPLSAYLNHIHWVTWQNSDSTGAVLDKLVEAIQQGNIVSEELPTEQPTTTPVVEKFPQPLPAAQPTTIPLELPEGTMNPESKFYIHRDSDTVALDTIDQEGVTIVIKGPRQMGKSSLLIHTVEKAREIGKQVAFVDFQLFDHTALSDPTTFYRQFCIWVTDELDLEDDTESFWNSPLGPSQSATRYMQRHLLKQLDGHLVLALDETESILETDFYSDFFGMLRTWHNFRRQTSVWNRLDMVLVTSTEPYDLIDNQHQSPFNVGEVINLQDFNAEQVKQLVALHENALTPGETDGLMEWLGGQPYLVRRALYLVAGNRLTSGELFAQAVSERGPFGDHLRYHLFRLQDKIDLVTGLSEIIRGNGCADRRVLDQLQGAGLVKQNGRLIVPRCKLYEQFFREQLNA